MSLLSNNTRSSADSSTHLTQHLKMDEVSPSDLIQTTEADTSCLISAENYDSNLQDTHIPCSENTQPSREKVKPAAYVTIGVLLLVNLLNYMDRFTIAGVLIDIKHYYHDLGNSEAGSIQTAFICTYMVFSPIFGYMGDRYTRKYIMAAGVFLWSAFTLASSFVPQDHFWAFVLLRALVGIGEASYSTIAPTIIADMFSSDMRTKALMVFYFAIPVGSGMGYIVGSNVADLFHQWQWALRVTPAFGVLCGVLIIFFCKEPKRGMSEGSDVHLVNTSVTTDLKTLLCNKSFMLSSVGFTCVAFVTGALAFLAPTFMVYATQIQGHAQDASTINLTFGGLTVAAGIIGVAFGAEFSRWYKRINPRADPLICAVGMITCAPFLFFSLVLSRYNTIATWILIFVGEVLLCLNWAVTADILLYVVIPTRRSLAESVQILMSHAFGDALSPYIIGQIADAIAENQQDPSRPFVQFPAMQTALYLTTFICVLGGGFYLATALYVEQDKGAAEKMTHVAGSIQNVSDGNPMSNGAYVNNIASEDSQSHPEGDQTYTEVRDGLAVSRSVII